MLAALIGILVLLAFLGTMVYLSAHSPDVHRLSQRERSELESLRGLVDDLKETAWDHRELDSPLATIIIDKIRAHERRGRELGP